MRPYSYHLYTFVMVAAKRWHSTQSMLIAFVMVCGRKRALHLKVRQQGPNKIADLSSSSSLKTMSTSIFIWRLLFPLIFLSIVIVPASAASKDQWRTRSIYQIMVDRFARTDLSTTAPCNVTARTYCGGTWKGIQSHLDYIQGMGFDAIWISPMSKGIEGMTGDGA